MPDHRKSIFYENVQCSECPTIIRRKTGVAHPVCITCKQRKANENWKKRRATYAHSKKAAARYAEGNTTRSE